jgi:sec-independent protein translocase protein TatA
MTVVNVVPQMLLSMPGGAEWMWIILAIIILFGGRKIPELAKGIGKGIREFNDAKDGVKSEIENEIKRKDNASSNTSH